MTAVPPHPFDQQDEQDERHHLAHADAGRRDESDRRRGTDRGLWGRYHARDRRIDPRAVTAAERTGRDHGQLPWTWRILENGDLEVLGLSGFSVNLVGPARVAQSTVPACARPSELTATRLIVTGSVRDLGACFTIKASLDAGLGGAAVRPMVREKAEPPPGAPAAVVTARAPIARACANMVIAP